MASVRASDILFRAGGAELVRTGAPFRRQGFDPNEPESYTFTRADSTTCATYVDQDGNLRSAAAGKLRADWTGSVCSLLLESSRTNLVTQSGDLTAANGWTLTGTLGAAAGISTAGLLSFTRVTNANAGALYRSVTLTGNAVKSFSCFVQYDGVTGVTHHGLYDNTAFAWRALAQVTWASDGTATCVGTTGTLLSFRLVGSSGSATPRPHYRIEMQATTCTAANAHLAYVSNDSGTTATSVRVTGMQVEDAPFPSSYIPNAGALLTRAADALTFPVGFEAQALTLYAALRRPLWADVTVLTTTPYLVQFGSHVVQGSIYTTAKWDVTVGGRNGQISPPAGASQEFFLRVGNIAAAGADVSVAVGSGYTSLGVTTAAASLGTTATIGALDGLLTKFLIARGSFTEAEMQAVAW